MNTKFLSVFFLAATCVLSACSRSDAVETTHELPDTLRVATLYSPTSYFIYREEKMGYDYSLVSALAREKGMALDLHVATSLASAVEMLDSGLVDLVAYEVPVTAEYRDHALPCGPESTTNQVLVQPRRGRAGERITDVTQLVGRDVYVEADSKYYYRLQNLNSELGGGINIHSVDRDTLITEDLIEMVSRGEIPLTVVDSDIARINKTYYPGLDITLPISFAQRSAWAVAPDRQWLADSINAWFSADKPRSENAALLKRYFELGKTSAPAYNLDLSKGRISPFDDIFRRYAQTLGWDWRLLASQCYVESRFDSSVVSWAGAKGVMQIMPSTARAYHTDPDALLDPDTSIHVASQIISALDRALASRVPDEQERVKFVVAAYNSGLAHIYDAITLASKTGRNPAVWEGNVAETLLLKSNPEYYNDPDVKYGYFRGRQTVAYVRDVMEVYDKCRREIKR